MIKEKKCKGQGLALGYGCGKMVNVSNRVYGLGKSCCYANWLMTSENGKIKMQKSLLKVQKPRIELENATKAHIEKKGIAGALLITKTVVHAYVRKRDIGKPCISCGCNWNSDFQAGHHYSANSFTTLRFNLDNISGQCQKCNLFQDGNFDNYALNLPNRIGVERYNELVRLASIDKQFEKVWDLESLKEIRNHIKSLK